MTAGTEIAGAQVVRPTALAGYQEGAIVSRTLINRKAATVTLFAFDEGQALSEHISPYDAMAQVLEGDAEVTIADTTLKLSGGDAVLMPAQQAHAVRALTRFKMLLTMVRSA